MPLDKPKAASFTFKGAAVYINCILAPATAAGVNRGNTELTFILDGNVEQIQRDAPNFPQYTTIFQKEGLQPDMKHRLTIVNGHERGKYNQAMMFLDSIVYTVDEDRGKSKTMSVEGQSGGAANPNNTKPPSAQGDSGQKNDDQKSDEQKSDEHKKVVIIAAVCGVLGAILLLAVSIWLYRRFKAKRTRQFPAPPFSDRSSWNPDGFSGPPTSAPSWHPSMFVRQYSNAPLSRRAPSVSSSRQHILSSSSDDLTWRDMSVQDVVSEPDTSNASKSVHPSSIRQYENPYGRRDPLVAVQQWQQRQSQVSSMESAHYPISVNDRRIIGSPHSPSIRIQPPPLSH
ncbi:hypothetical protein EYR38_001233 [Pleurotus pulmonarius]|nr:hypothetical protein EYR38_001233 [Pleurotus pulmonarius]